MTDWLDCRDDFMEADVIRWRETVWSKPSKRRKAQPSGEREVTGEILRHESGGGLLTILVRASRVLSDRTRRGNVPLLPIGETVQRRPETLRNGNAVRLPWSDESVRAQLAREREARQSKT